MDKLKEVLKELAEDMAHDELMINGLIVNHEDIYNPRVKGVYTATMQDVYDRYMLYLEKKFEGLL